MSEMCRKNYIMELHSIELLKELQIGFFKRRVPHRLEVWQGKGTDGPNKKIYRCGEILFNAFNWLPLGCLLPSQILLMDFDPTGLLVVEARPM